MKKLGFSYGQFRKEYPCITEALKDYETEQRLNSASREMIPEFENEMAQDSSSAILRRPAQTSPLGKRSGAKHRSDFSGQRDSENAPGLGGCLMQSGRFAGQREDEN